MQISANSGTSILLINVSAALERESWGHSSALPSIVFWGGRGSSLESLQLLKLEFSAITEKNSMPSLSESELEVRIYHQ